MGVLIGEISHFGSTSDFLCADGHTWARSGFRERNVAFIVAEAASAVFRFDGESCFLGRGMLDPPDAQDSTQFYKNLCHERIR